MESTLGPDTGELGLRVGLHSGPVTGGVLRGEKARFQLFGDSMNTTARIEAGGHKIHVSEATADLVSTAGKGH
jgi:class 3 adenylate cyclase